jgi:hypothetical protein
VHSEPIALSNLACLSAAAYKSESKPKAGSNIFSKYLAYLKHHPGDQATEWIPIVRRAEEIKTGKRKPGYVIPARVLGSEWSMWIKDYPTRSVIEFDKSKEGYALSLGASLDGGNSEARFDSEGSPTFPTEEGSFYVLRSHVEKPVWSYFRVIANGLTIKYDKDTPIYLAVIKPYGLVLVSGKCRISFKGHPEKTVSAG